MWRTKLNGCGDCRRTFLIVDSLSDIPKWNNGRFGWNEGSIIYWFELNVKRGVIEEENIKGAFSDKLKRSLKQLCKHLRLETVDIVII